jgi:hypothetical protein
MSASHDWIIFVNDASIAFNKMTKLENTLSSLTLNGLRSSNDLLTNLTVLLNLNPHHLNRKLSLSSVPKQFLFFEICAENDFWANLEICHTKHVQEK